MSLFAHSIIAARLDPDKCEAPGGEGGEDIKDLAVAALVVAAAAAVATCGPDIKRRTATTLVTC